MATDADFQAGARDLCRTSLAAFTELVAFPAAAAGAKFLENWHYLAVAHYLELVVKKKIKRLILTMPPRSGKSILASVALPAWALGLDPTRRIVVASYAEGLARTFSQDCRRAMGSPLYKSAFPGTRVSAKKDTELEFRTTAGGHRHATSVGGTLTGRGGNTIVIDDPLKAADAYSETAREGAQQWFKNTVVSRLDNKAEDSIVVVSQRLHDDDLIGGLIRQGGWEHLSLPAIAEQDETIPLGNGRFHYRKAGDVLHPDRESIAVLNELKREMGSITFSAQYQQSPVPEGGNMIRRSWFTSHDGPPIPCNTDRIIVSWDTAMSAKELSSYSVGLVLLVRGETVFVLDVIRDQLEYPNLRRKVIETHERWRNVSTWYELLIENKGSGLSLIQDLRHSNVHAIAVDPAGDKIMRMQAQTARIEAGAVSLPRTAEWLEEFTREICGFPAGRHNDQVDALSQGLERAFRQWGVAISGPVLGHY
jgi:predicted phage terminase large subunit-like protein